MKFTRDTAGYNERRYGKPYVGVLDLETGRVVRWGQWIGTTGCSGILEIEVEPGDVIVDGQKDNRGRGGSMDFAVIQRDGDRGDWTSKAPAIKAGRALKAELLAERKATAAAAATAKPVAEAVSPEPILITPIADPVANTESEHPPVADPVPELPPAALAEPEPTVGDLLAELGAGTIAEAIEKVRGLLSFVSSRRPVEPASSEPAPSSASLGGDVEVYTDGACKGNPGPGGWGALISSPHGDQEYFGGEANTTNNRMELMAVIKAMEALASSPDTHKVVLHLDSQYVRKGITEWIKSWKANGWKTSGKQPVKNVDLWQQLDELVASSRHQLVWKWVKGHAGVPGNEHADALANRGVESIS